MWIVCSSVEPTTFTQVRGLRGIVFGSLRGGDGGSHGGVSTVVLKDVELKRISQSGGGRILAVGLRLEAFTAATLCAISWIFGIMTQFCGSF